MYVCTDSDTYALFQLWFFLLLESSTRSALNKSACCVWWQSLREGSITWWKRKKVGIISAKSAHRGSQDGKGCVQGCRGGDQSHSESAVFRCPEMVVVADRGQVSDAWKKAMPGKRQCLFCLQARKDLGNYRLLHSKFFTGKNKNIKHVWKKN